MNVCYIAVETIAPLESTAGVSTEDYGTEESVMEELEKEQVHSNPDIDSPSKEPDVYAGETHTEIDMVANGQYHVILNPQNLLMPYYMRTHSEQTR